METQILSDADARLKRIAGQVAGIRGMVAEGRYCVDVLLQVAAVQAALGEVSKILLGAHVQRCLTEAVKNGSTRERQNTIDDVMNLFARYCGFGARSKKNGATNHRKTTIRALAQR